MASAVSNAGSARSSPQSSHSSGLKFGSKPGSVPSEHSYTTKGDPTNQQPHPGAPSLAVNDVHCYADGKIVHEGHYEHFIHSCRVGGIGSDAGNGMSFAKEIVKKDFKHTEQFTFENVKAELTIERVTRFNLVGSMEVAEALSRSIESIQNQCCLKNIHAEWQMCKGGYTTTTWKGFKSQSGAFKMTVMPITNPLQITNPPPNPNRLLKLTAPITKPPPNPNRLLKLTAPITKPPPNPNRLLKLTAPITKPPPNPNRFLKLTGP
ncbi:unnamed protein product [Calypogeia fissa]